MALELRVKTVLAQLAAGFLVPHAAGRGGVVAVENHDAPALVAGGQVVAALVELHGRQDVGVREVVHLRRGLVAEALAKLPVPALGARHVGGPRGAFVRSSRP